MPLFRRAPPPEALSAAMAGVKMGDRLLVAGGDGPPMTIMTRQPR